MSEYVVRLRLEYAWATAIVTADSADEARAKAEQCDWDDAPDIDCAELVNWDIMRVERND